MKIWLNVILQNFKATTANCVKRFTLRKGLKGKRVSKRERERERERGRKRNRGHRKYFQFRSRIQVIQGHIERSIKLNPFLFEPEH